MPEITDEQLAIYQRGLGLLKKLQDDPKSKPHIEQAVKAIFPDVVTEAEQTAARVEPLLAPVTETLSKIQARLDADAAEREAAANAKVEQGLTDTFTSLRQQGLTEEGEKAVKELMVARNIADPEAAFALFQRNNPPPPSEAPAWQPDGWDMGSTAGAPGGVNDLAGLMKNEDAWADREAASVLNEIRVGKAA